MTTTIQHLGWSGFSNPIDEQRFNQKIVNRTNRLLKKLQQPTCSLNGSCALTLHCDIKNSNMVSAIAYEYRHAAHCGYTVKETTEELLAEWE